ncbi:MAG: hypothetical protein J7604_07045 [Sporocytophaga sp.]|uniref:hypothetical protein n=1 Tax=Sporocytophaga sp. TaxID=2231183 RepID=UPI001B1FA901|nr:hypothetical protein [Sporocytophaga sp.]MBO9699949.1 hypothetical protein [Sporocytophaga sp.]
MMKIILTILLFIFTLLGVSGQTPVTDLYGFSLGQYRETATNEFGKPIEQGKFKDGYEYEVFLLNPDSSLYLVIEYAANHTDVIWSIQISGSNATKDIGFKGLRLGADKKEVERVIGKPEAKENIGEYGENWNYEKANYSIEISKSGKLSSAKIKNNFLDNKPDVKKLPKFENIISIMSSSNNAEIASILAPGVEIYYKDKTWFLGKSIKNEINTDYSKVFQTIREISDGLNQINTSDINSYEENMRLAMGQNPKHVVKIKTGHKIKEIVFDYINGQYLIWEINAK